LCEIVHRVLPPRRGDLLNDRDCGITADCDVPLEATARASSSLQEVCRNGRLEDCTEYHMLYFQSDTFVELASQFGRARTASGAQIGGSKSDSTLCQTLSRTTGPPAPPRRGNPCQMEDDWDVDVIRSTTNFQVDGTTIVVQIGDRPEAKSFKVLRTIAQIFVIVLREILT